MSANAEPIERLVFEAQRLVTEHPPVLRHPNKQLLFQIACPPGSVHGGHLTYTRWAAMPLPGRCDPAAAARCAEERRGFYDYLPAPGHEGAVEWHVNFADPNLFVAYGSALFAQDEMQVAEHPALGSLREALPAGGRRALTVEGGRPTPALVMGVERRCRVETQRHGLYGNAFAHADAGTIRRATIPISPPTVTNLIAMAAPTGGGYYSAATIEFVLATAFTGFSAAALQSHRAAGDVPVVVHSGLWGCGAFGGNRVLMLALQMLAARPAGLDLLVLHLRDQEASDAFHAARELLSVTLAAGGAVSTPALIQQVAGVGFRWGTSDGN